MGAEEVRRRDATAGCWRAASLLTARARDVEAMASGEVGARRLCYQVGEASRV